MSRETASVPGLTTSLAERCSRAGARVGFPRFDSPQRLS